MTITTIHGNTITIYLSRLRFIRFDPYCDNHGRPREIEGRYDPDNRFRVNQNIPPAEAA